MRLLIIERLLLLVGVLCLGWVAATSAQAMLYQKSKARTLDVAIAASGARPVTDTDPIAVTGAPQTPSDPPPPSVDGPIGRLEIPRLGISVVVMAGDDEATLARAVGYLPDTPKPWETGNTALAAHRDTFFRPLERVRVGDDIFVDTPHGRFQYRVRRFLVVQPEDVWVLDPSTQPMLTLITCYPFRYVGPAPKRFIVQADRV